MAVGFDKHDRGAFDPKPAEWGLPQGYGDTGFMLTTQFFAMKIQRYMALNGISRKTLGRVAEKAFRNGTLADHAWRRSPVDLDTILDAPMVNDPLTKYMFCSPDEGGVALILASEKKARELGAKAVRLKTASVRTRPPGSFEVFAAAIDIERGVSASVMASRAAYEAAGIGPSDIDVAQLQDTESGAEIIHLAENGFCGDGDQEAWIAEGRTEIGGSLPVNTDGGCLACGEPIGASGLRQVYENVLQLRGEAGARQVQGSPRTAYSQVYGAPGISAVAILER
jgi:acetyl-CoA acetyltransferase